jgi:hypothetical protein
LDFKETQALRAMPGHKVWLALEV